MHHFYTINRAEVNKEWVNTVVHNPAFNQANELDIRYTAAAYVVLMRLKFPRALDKNGQVLPEPAPFTTVKLTRDVSDNSQCKEFGPSETITSDWKEIDFNTLKYLIKGGIFAHLKAFVDHTKSQFTRVSASGDIYLAPGLVLKTKSFTDEIVNKISNPQPQDLKAYFEKYDPTKAGHKIINRIACKILPPGTTDAGMYAIEYYPILTENPAYRYYNPSYDFESGFPDNNAKAFENRDEAFKDYWSKREWDHRIKLPVELDDKLLNEHEENCLLLAYNSCNNAKTLTERNILCPFNVTQMTYECYRKSLAVIFKFYNKQVEQLQVHCTYLKVKYQDRFKHLWDICNVPGLNQKQIEEIISEKNIDFDMASETDRRMVDSKFK